MSLPFDSGLLKRIVAIDILSTLYISLQINGSGWTELIGAEKMDKSGIVPIDQGVDFVDPDLAQMIDEFVHQFFSDPPVLIGGIDTDGIHARNLLQNAELSHVEFTHQKADDAPIVFGHKRCGQIIFGGEQSFKLELVIFQTGSFDYFLIDLEDGFEIAFRHQSCADGIFGHGSAFSVEVIFSVLPLREIFRRSTGRGGGTVPPTILVTAPNREGQAFRQVPHLMHLS
jgi:hypothetical protein